MPAPIIFFRSAADLRKWFEQNHETTRELLVGFHRKSTGRPTLTLPESVAEALCFGWIDAREEHRCMVVLRGAAGYRRTITWWVMSAKQDETKNRRLQKLVEHSAARQRLV